MKIYYGSKDIWIDVTNICLEKLTNNNNIVIHNDIYKKYINDNNCNNYDNNYDNDYDYNKLFLDKANNSNRNSKNNRDNKNKHTDTKAYKPIDDYNYTNKSIYDTDDIDLFRNKIDEILG